MQRTIQKITAMTKKFNKQSDAIKYYKHSWKYIEKHYHVKRCYDNSGFKGYFIETK